MNSPEQIFEIITPEALLDRVAGLRKENWRLACISAARLGEHLELVYSFDRDYSLLNLRLALPAEDPKVQSISSIYWCSVLYENEMHDLFNLEVEGMAVDFKGNLYRTAVKFPFGSTKPPQTAQMTTSMATAGSAAVPMSWKNGDQQPSTSK